MNEDDSAAVTTAPNTNWDWFRHISAVFRGEEDDEAAPVVDKEHASVAAVAGD
jgi:hypothetical protein